MTDSVNGDDLEDIILDRERREAFGPDDDLEVQAPVELTAPAESHVYRRQEGFSILQLASILRQHFADEMGDVNSEALVQVFCVGRGENPLRRLEIVDGKLILSPDC
jgi:hypothetical protein